MQLPALVAQSGPPVLELRGVKAAYEQVEVLHGVDLAVPAGAVVAVLGPNGAGKTTMLKVASGMLRPTSGDVWLAGRCVTGASPVDLARLGLCSIPEGRGVFPNLTVAENLWMASHRGVSRAAIEERVFPVFPRLKERRRQAAGTMSGGEQQMLAMARAIATDPAVLLIDELSMGLAPLVVERLFETVADIARSGVTVLLVEQFAQTALGVADLAAVMTGGRITETGTPAAVASGLHSAYLGGAEAVADTFPGPRAPGAGPGPGFAVDSGPAPDPATEPAPEPAPGPGPAKPSTGLLTASAVPPAPPPPPRDDDGGSRETRGETRGEPMSTNTAGVPPTVPEGIPVVPQDPPGTAAERTESLAHEVAGLRIKAPSTTLDKQLMWLGVALMVAGIGTGIGAYIMAHTTRLPLTQRDAIVVALCGIPISIAGMAVYLRYSLAGFLRFWIARLIATQQQAGQQQPPMR
ncbi:ABC transporter ATP-binding protein [Yinghuangia sp. YIM S10712]|uniref:ABC transporter ATP-binding protein n=1 Tax=Yinghuangia sp. YIM S10712 TaxID=3436930 RepID=UPI003F534E89